jgi:hypothetical protein
MSKENKKSHLISTLDRETRKSSTFFQLNFLPRNKIIYLALRISFFQFQTVILKEKHLIFFNQKELKVFDRSFFQISKKLLMLKFI